MKVESNIKRCVIYTRKSTEEGLDLEFNSLDAQYEACAAYIKSQSSNGWRLVGRRYDDGGYSGGNVNRPALRELQKDITDGLVDIVVVYKIDRLSRSLCDFTDLSKIFEEHGVSFVSVTQQIDTSNAAGRMMLNILMSFAQFEREMTADRIRDKIYATRKKGMWTGGVTPFGYKVVDKRLEVDPDAAETVRMMFRRYAATASTRQVARELNDAHIPRPGGLWLPCHVSTLLRNCVYIGKLPIKRTGQMFDGLHQPIVDEPVWRDVQRLLDANRPTDGKLPRRETLAPLKGLLKCGTCGSAMTPVFSNSKAGKNRRYIYYRCARDAKQADHKCPIRNIAAREIERMVYSQLRCILHRDDVVRLVSEGDPQKEHDYLEATANVDQFWDRLYPAERDRLLHLIVREVRLWPDKVEIALNVPDGEVKTLMVACHLVTDLGRQRLMAVGGVPETGVPEEVAVVKALARGIQWVDLLESGTFHDKRDLAEALDLSPSYLSKVLRFPFLSPVLIERIVNGEIPDASVTKLMAMTSPFWADHEL